MQIMVLFSIHPIGAGEHVGDDVAKAVEIIQRSGLEHHLGPSGTTLVGDWEEVMDVVRRCHAALADGNARVSSILKIDHKVAGFEPGAIEGKVERVRSRLDRSST